jgi:hypothetical protein
MPSRQALGRTMFRLLPELHVSFAGQRGDADV